MFNLRSYILEKASIEVQIMQYIKAMEAILLKFHNDVNHLDLSPLHKQALESRSIKLILGKKDYTSSSERNRLFKELSGPIKEHFMALPPQDTLPVVKHLSPKTKDIFQGFIKSSSAKLKGATSKLKGLASNMQASPKNPKNIVIAAAVVAVIVALSLGVKSLVKKARKNSRVKKIIDRDVNPIAISLIRGISKQEVRGTNQISQMMRELEQAIVQKYFMTEV